MAFSSLLFSWLPTTELPETVDRSPLPSLLFGYGHWTSILPPVIAVAIALCFRSLVAALLTAFVYGSFLTFGINPIEVALGAWEAFILYNLTQQFQIFIFGFLFALVGLIHVAYRSGGIEGLVRIFMRVAKGRNSAKVATMLAGLAVFFDDYSNTVVVGSTMRSLTDRWKISREKLAYIVDSTTAPIAGVAVVSTWIAFEVFLLGTVARSLGIPRDGYEIFILLLPFRFYCLGTLIFVFLNSVTGRDFGPMLTAERRAFHRGWVSRPGAQLLAGEGGAVINPPKGQPRVWQHAAFPLLLVIGLIIAGLLLVGSARVSGWGWGVSLTTADGLRTVIGAAVYDIYDPNGPGAMLVLLVASVCGGVLAVALPVGRRILTVKQAARAYIHAIPTLWMAIFILLMAWSMKTICETVGTDAYLISLLGDRLPMWALPVLTFAVAAVMSFSMGTSWGTMGILIPVILPLAYALGTYDVEGHGLFFLTAAAILDGAIFGDHCSPISDTTVLSSIATGCDHIDHVSTQFVYAITTMLLAASLGYLAVAAGMPGWCYFLLFPAAALAVLFGIGRSVEA